MGDAEVGEVVDDGERVREAELRSQLQPVRGQDGTRGRSGEARPDPWAGAHGCSRLSERSTTTERAGTVRSSPGDSRDSRSASRPLDSRLLSAEPEV